jgi:hypothetical protein
LALPEMVGLLRADLHGMRRGGQAARDQLPGLAGPAARVSLAVGAHKTSMLQDLEAGKRLELDCMTGATRNCGAAASSRMYGRSMPAQTADQPGQP